MNTQELEQMIADIEWEQFQEPTDGNIYFWHLGKIKFCYRIGAHFKRPMEAIMAQGQFIRMRAAPHYEHFELKRLDPDNVDKCLYFRTNIPLSYTPVYADKDWSPKLLKGWEQSLGLQQAAQAAQQAQQQAQQQYQRDLHNQPNISTIPYGGYVNVTTTNNTGLNQGLQQGLLTGLANSLGLKW